MNVFDLYLHHGMTARKASSHKGGEYHGPCPGCGGEDRFHIWPQQGNHGTFWCRQCGKSGDAIKFLREFSGMGFREACIALGVDLPAQPIAATPCLSRATTRWQPEEIQPPAETWQEKAQAFVSWCHSRLLDNDDQLQWLASRGVNIEAVKLARLGWNPGDAGKDIWRPRESWGLPKELREDTGRPRRLWLPKGLVIPCLQSRTVVRLRIRRTEGDPRYYVVPGSSRNPFYLGHDKQVAVIVESELDALALYSAVGDIVGTYAIGNDSAKPDARSAERLSQHTILLVSTDFDHPDHNGLRAGSKAAAWWLNNFAQAKRWPVPKGKDPGESFMLGISLRDWILTALPLSLQPPQN